MGWETRILTGLAIMLSVQQKTMPLITTHHLLLRFDFCMLYIVTVLTKNRWQHS